MPKGGKRPGAGRKFEGRKTCSLRANAEEWKLILTFAKIVKHGDKQSAKNFIEQFIQTMSQNSPD